MEVWDELEQLQTLNLRSSRHLSGADGVWLIARALADEPLHIVCIINSTFFDARVMVLKRTFGSQKWVVTCATLQTCLYIIFSFQHAVLRKKMHEVHMRYLANDIHADVLAWLRVQQRACSASEFYKVEQSSIWWN